MDNSQEDKKAPVAPANTAQPEPVHSYKTENIGKWKSKQEDYFAKQNQELDAKKTKQKATRKKILPFAVAGGALVVIGLATWGIITLVQYLNRPTLEETATDPSIIGGNSSAAIDNYQTYLQQVYDEALAAAGDEPPEDAQQKANDAVREAIAKSAATEAGEKYRDAMRMSEMLMYHDTDRCDKIFDLENQINPDNLNLHNQYRYKHILQNCYELKGDTERANELWKEIALLHSQVFKNEIGELKEGVSE